MADNDILTNINYLNKDFRSIYTELLDLAKNLTNKWDPSISNESDPGVVLIKLLAVLGDKNNYNIDKNILEAFPSTVTQYGNARKLFDLCGYTMHWYTSGQTELTLKNKSADLGKVNYSLPLYTMFTDITKKFVYTLIPQPSPYNTSLPQKASQKSYIVMEGKHQSYDVNGISTIQLTNLDADLRLYFEDTHIAENGIFIQNVGDEASGEYWKAVDNLSSYPLNNKVYKFGVLPNSNTCYIQFPQDIYNLIGSGITVDYLISNGLEGNIKANTLNSFLEDVTIDVNGNKVSLNENFIVSNPASVSSGTDPETIEEAYESYEKVKGTFNTLVTVRDFENAIYNMYVDLQHVVSNCVVSDRTNDLSASYVQQLYNQTSSVAFSNNKLTAFDLELRCLKNESNITNEDTYNSTFNQDNTAVATIKSVLFDSGDYSLCSYDLNVPESGETFIYRGLYTVNCRIITSYKVSRVEASEITQNVWKALYLKFNAREVSFGKEIKYSDLSSTILNADARIKDIILYEPEVAIKEVTVDNTIKDLTPSSIYATMILRGNTPLLKFNDSFQPDFGMTITSYPTETNPIVKMDTEVKLTVPVGESLTLSDNENVQVIYPQLTPASEYYFVKYVITPEDTKFKPGEMQSLEGITIKLTYTDTNGAEKTDTLNYGDTPYVMFKGFNAAVSGSGTLASGQSIVVYKYNKVEGLGTTNTDKQGYRCYWITNDIVTEGGVDYYRLVGKETFTDNVATRILDNNEWFIYTDADYSGLVILGAGTLLTIHDANGTESDWKIQKGASYDIISSEGIAASSNITWKQLTNSEYVDTQIMSVDTYGKGVTLTNTATGPSAKDLFFNNSLTPLGEGDLKVGDTPLSQPDMQVRSRLNLNMGPGIPQTLISRSDGGVSRAQLIKLYYKPSDTPSDKSSEEIKPTDGELNVESNYRLNITGGTNISTWITPLDEAITPGYLLKMYSYTYGPGSQRRDLSGRISLTSTTSLTLPAFGSDFDALILPVDVIKGTLTSVKVGENACELFNSDKAVSNLSGTHTFFIDLSACKTSGATITFTLGTDTEVVVGKLLYCNYTLSGETLREEVLAAIKDKDFNYSYEVPAADLVEDPTTPASFWNVNHYLNRFTIPQLNTSESIIQVSRTSLLDQGR